ncbi:MAG TPA: limonene-1,2-epoxide hydrolase family protein [Acidimicrobiales bacterium]|nr:limonene-1,2-epoxide hydrolase family protein [Acidimicrobiales bacterium]
MRDPYDVVRDFCEAMGKKDLDAVRGLLGPDVVYHNIPMDPIEGFDATVASLEAQFEMFETIEFRIVAVAVTGHTVLTERIDLFTTAAGADGTIPVMGAFDVEDSRITSWRDYFDMGQAGKALEPPGDAPGA